MRNKGMSIGILCFLFFFSFLTGIGFCQINWIANFTQGLSLAKSTGKPVFLYIYKDNVNDCIRYNRETFSNQAVAGFLNEKFHCVAVHADKDQATLARYGVFRVPCVLIIDSTGREFLRLVTFYPPEKLLVSLNQMKTYDQEKKMKPEAGGAVQSSSDTILYEPFQSIYGWENEGSSLGSTAQIGLVQGVRENAFRIDYELVPGTWNYIQVHRTFPEGRRDKLPEQFSVVFHLAGSGGHNDLNIKFADMDGTNFGALMPIPVDNKPHKITLTSNEVKYLWGGKDQILENVAVFLIAVSPGKESNPQNPNDWKGTVYIDEMEVIPGKKDPPPAFFLLNPETR